MTALLTGLWLAVLAGSLVRLCQRSSRQAILPVIVVLVPTAPRTEDAEAWARTQIDALGTPEL